MAETTTVRIERDFRSSQAQVFDAWLDLKSAAQWLFATPGGRLTSAAIDPKEGGRFLFVERRESGDAEHYGRYLRIERPVTLIFDFSTREDMADATPVTVEVADRGEGARLTLSHGEVPAEFADRTQAGGTSILGRLAETLGEG